MLLKVVTGYDRSRFNPVVCCIKEGGEIADELVRRGIKVHILHRMKGHGFDWRAIRDVYRVIKEERIHILRTHQYHANLYGRLAGIVAGVPVIIPSFHNLYLSPDRPKFHRMLINRLLAVWSDRLVAVSRAVAEDIQRFDRVSPEKIRIIHNGVDIERFRVSINKKDARRMFGLPEEGRIVGSLGRLTQQKGYEYLIEAVSDIREVVVVIAGDGPQKAELQRKCESLGVECRFLGAIPPEEVPCFLRALDIFCSPSLWEGLPSALIEALASGLPVVVSDIPPHREIAGDAGVYVSPADSTGLGRAIKGLIDDTSRHKRFIRAAMERAELFSIYKTIREYEALFEDCLRGVHHL